MLWPNWIIEALDDAAAFFYHLQYHVEDWIWPFNLVAEVFYHLGQAFNRLSYNFTDFAGWIYGVSPKIEGMLDWDTFWALLLSRLPGIQDVNDWFSDWWNRVRDVVNDWWNSVKDTVRGWIDTATQGLDALKVAWDNFWSVTWPDWMSRFDSLRAAWDNFWTVTLPYLVSFDWLKTWWNDRLADIDTFVDDKLKDWFPFYDDLVKIWEDIKIFFTDPLEFLWTKFADWFLGPEG